MRGDAPSLAPHPDPLPASGARGRRDKTLSPIVSTGSHAPSRGIPLHRPRAARFRRRLHRRAAAGLPDRARLHRSPGRDHRHRRAPGLGTSHGRRGPHRRPARSAPAAHRRCRPHGGDRGGVRRPPRLLGSAHRGLRRHSEPFRRQRQCVRAPGARPAGARERRPRAHPGLRPLQLRRCAGSGLRVAGGSRARLPRRTRLRRSTASG